MSFTHDHFLLLADAAVLLLTERGTANACDRRRKQTLSIRVRVQRTPNSSCVSEDVSAETRPPLNDDQIDLFRYDPSE
jgi:hypothetical protein